MNWLGPEEWQAVALSLRVALTATALSLPLGVMVALLLARGRFPGLGVLNGLVHLPLILPPVVTGYLLLLTFGMAYAAGEEIENLVERVVEEDLRKYTLGRLPLVGTLTDNILFHFRSFLLCFYQSF